MNYRLLIDYAVIEFVETLPRKDQRLLRNRFVAIQSDPQKFSDYIESADSNHRLDIHICGNLPLNFGRIMLIATLKSSTPILPISQTGDRIKLK